MIQYEDGSFSEIMKEEMAENEFNKSPLADTLFIGEDKNLNKIKEKLSQKFTCPMCEGSGYQSDLTSCINCNMAGEI